MVKDDSDNHLQDTIRPNAHPEAALHQGGYYTIPNPLPEDHPHNQESRPFPDTGWCGTPEIPSREGGNEEEDFMSKPPYRWKSEENKFIPKYTA